MNEPLIDKDSLLEICCTAVGGRDLVDPLLDYLHGVLTPEALDPTETVPHGEYVMRRRASGDDLHRRIFGRPR